MTQCIAMDISHPIYGKGYGGDSTRCEAEATVEAIDQYANNNGYRVLLCETHAVSMRHKRWEGDEAGFMETNERVYCPLTEQVERAALRELAQPDLAKGEETIRRVVAENQEWLREMADK